MAPSPFDDENTPLFTVGRSPRCSPSSRASGAAWTTCGWSRRSGRRAASAATRATRSASSSRWSRWPTRASPCRPSAASSSWNASSPPSPGNATNWPAASPTSRVRTYAPLLTRSANTRQASGPKARRGPSGSLLSRTGPRRGGGHLGAVAAVAAAVGGLAPPVRVRHRAASSIRLSDAARGRASSRSVSHVIARLRTSAASSMISPSWPRPGTRRRRHRRTRR